MNDAMEEKEGFEGDSDFDIDGDDGAALFD